MSMTPMQRVLTALDHKEADRVPFLILSTMHYAKEHKIPLEEYFSKAENVVEGQLAMRKQFGHDCLYPLFSASIEVTAWGGEVMFRADGPPSAGRPFIGAPQDIKALRAPSIDESGGVQEMLKTIRLMKHEVQDDVPIFGVAIAPFSLPVMQMGFGPYLDLIADQRGLFHHLMAVNEEFCASWANAQLEAGATSILYVDPMSSPRLVPKSWYLELGYPIAKRMIESINGPVATSFASESCLPIIDEVATTGTVGVGVSSEEDLAKLKAACRGKLTVIGNLNGLEMRRWTQSETERHVKAAIAQAGSGGGFVLADNHGEIPFQVPHETLLAISEAVRKWGKYPLEWIENEGP